MDYTYDLNNQLDLVKVGGTTLVDYNYDQLGRRLDKTFRSTSPEQRATYQFDMANQLSSITNKLLPGTNISTHAYPVYDAVGNRKIFQRTLQTQQTQETQYTYNDIYELTSVTGAQTHSYDYDLVGNREAANGITYTPNDLNQYSNVGGTEYTYDDNGNLTSDGERTFTYDEENRLSSVVGSLSSAVYSYDALNRRVSKTVDGLTTYFIYNDSSVIAEYDGTGGLTAEYVLGDQIDEVLTMTSYALLPTTYYYFYDGLGSVTEITDSTGALVENYVYDAYGNPSVTSSLIENPYMFTGRRWDEESGTYYYRARQYDPVTGRFTSRDPLGFVDSLNLYIYTINNPINGIDPFGTATWPIRGKVEETVRQELDKIPDIPLLPGKNRQQSILEYAKEIAKTIPNKDALDLAGGNRIDEIQKKLTDELKKQRSNWPWDQIEDMINKLMGKDQVEETACRTK